jgi:hypothetical protein
MWAAVPKLASGLLLDPPQHLLEALPVDRVLVEVLKRQVRVLVGSHLEKDFPKGELARRLALAALLRIRVEHEGHNIPVKVFQQLLEEHCEMLVRSSNTGYRRVLVLPSECVFLCSRGQNWSFPNPGVSCYWRQHVRANGAQKKVLKEFRHDFQLALKRN